MRQTPVITNKGRVIAFVPNSSFLHRQPRSWVRPARTRANQSCDARQGVLGNVVHTNRDIYTATPVFTLQMHIIAKNVYKVFPSCIWGRVTSLVVCKCDLLLALPLTTLYHPPKETILRFSPTSHMALGSWESTIMTTSSTARSGGITPLLSELNAMEASRNEMGPEVFSDELALFPSLTGDKVNLVHNLWKQGILVPHDHENGYNWVRISNIRWYLAKRSSIKDPFHFSECCEEDFFRHYLIWSFRMTWSVDLTDLISLFQSPPKCGDRTNINMLFDERRLLCWISDVTSDTEHHVLHKRWIPTLLKLIERIIISFKVFFQVVVIVLHLT